MLYDLAIKYLPHDTPMVMIQNVHIVDEDNCICSVLVSKEGVLSPFLNEQHALPNIYTIELMAQTIGVWSGYHASTQNNQPKLGMLLGGRAIKIMNNQFEQGSMLIIHAKLTLTDTKLANFDCTIKIDDICVATGRLNVYEPDNSELSHLFSRERLGEKSQ